MVTATRLRVGWAVCLLALAAALAVAGGALAAPTPQDGAPALESGVQPTHDGLTVSPQEIDFDEADGPLSPGETTTATVTIRNDSPESINVSRAVITGDTEAFALTRPVSVEDESDLGGGTVTIPPGFSQTGVVEFAPPAPGEYEAAVTLYDDSGHRLTTVRATGTAVAAEAPDIAVEPRSLNFEGTTVGETVARTVRVTNDGDATLSVAATRIRGSGDYDVSGPAPFDLEPGDSALVTVVFSPETTDPQSALLEIRSNDPEQPVFAVPLSNSDTQAEVQTTQQDDQRTVDVDVQNADAGEPVNVTVPSSADEDETVDVQNVAFVPERSGNVSLNVTDSTEPLATTPELETDDNATGLKYINVTKSLSNDEIEEVRYRYRIPKERVANLTSDGGALNDSRVDGEPEAGPEAITMYRYVDGEWVEETTRHVRETPTHHVYVTTGDGFSEWTAAAKRPDISVAEAEANVEAATVGENILVGVTLVNNGGADGVFTTRLLADGEVREQREVTVPNNASVLVSLETQFDRAETYEVTVNGVSAGVVTVDNDSAVVESPSGQQAGDDGSDGDGSDGGSGLLPTQPVLMGVGALVLVLSLGALLVGDSSDDAAAESVSRDPVDGDEGGVVQVEGYDDAGDDRQAGGAGPNDGRDGGRR